MRFVSSFFEEFGARRLRLRKAIGDRGASLFEFLLLGGMVVGVLAAFTAPTGSEPLRWGLASPLGFVAAHVALEAARRRTMRGDVAKERLRKRFDWASLVFSISFAALGVFAFWKVSVGPDAGNLPPAYEPPPNSANAEIGG